MTEALIALPILILLSIGIAQLAFIFRAQMDLDYACFRAARKAVVMADQANWLQAAKKEAVRTLRPSILKMLKDPSLAGTFDLLTTNNRLEITSPQTATTPHIGQALSLDLAYQYRLPLPFGRLFSEPAEITHDINPLPAPQPWSVSDQAQALTGEGFHFLPLKSHCALTLESGSYVTAD